MQGKLTILFIGDIVGKLGRTAVKTILPKWQQQYKPDVIVANVENLAHGKGVTRKTLAEMTQLSIDIFTAGDHIWDKAELRREDFSSFPIALPANDSRTVPHCRWQTVTVGHDTLFVLNLVGQVFMDDEHRQSPFHTFDRVYEEMGKPRFLIVDMHAEATSEKVAFGYYVDGRASLVCGTHTHIPTADARILPSSTGYITDCGMTGSNDSVLGVRKDIIINRFLNATKEVFEYPESGPIWINGVLADLDKKTGTCIKLQLLTEMLTIN